MTVLGVVPARGGSRRVPRKNLAHVGGRSLVDLAIASGHGALLVDEVLVSTDDDEIAEEALRCGGRVPFLRPAELSGDDADDLGVLRHALAQHEAQHGPVDVVVLLRPTAPFRRAATVDRVVASLRNPVRPRPVDGVRTVTRSRGGSHPCWSLRAAADGRAVPYVDGVSLADHPRSQTLPEAFALAGVVDAYRADVVRSAPSLLSVDLGIEVVDDLEATDVDTTHDLAVARALAEATDVLATLAPPVRHALAVGEHR